MQFIKIDINNIKIIKDKEDDEWFFDYGDKLPKKIRDFFNDDNDNIILTKQNFIAFFPKFLYFYNDIKKLGKIFFDKWVLEIIDTENEKNTAKREHFLSLINNDIIEVDLNKNFYNLEFKPYSFQEKFAKNILSKKSIGNFSSPGSGKTIISFMAAISLYADNKINTLFVIGPKSSTLAWYLEGKVVSNKILSLKENRIDDYFLNFSNKNPSIEENISWVKNKLNIVFINFHKFDKNRMTNEKLVKMLSKRKVMAIVDEAHNIKNINGERFKNIKKFLDKDFIKYKVLLTGTPIPRKTYEFIFVPDLLFNYNNDSPLLSDDFIYDNPNDFSKKTKNAVKNIFDRYDKEDLVFKKQLKPKRIIIHKINFNDIYLKLQNLIQDSEFTINLNDFDINKINKAKIIRLMQASSYPPLLKKPLSESIKDYENYIFKDDNADDEEINKNKYKDIRNFEEKLQIELNGSEIRKMINDFELGHIKNPRWEKAINIIKNYNNERIIVWDIFIESMNSFERFLKNNIKNNIYKINGKVDKNKRISILNQFKNDKNGILIASPATLSESISLHNHVDRAIYLFRNYVGAQYFQSIDRIHRLVGEGNLSNDKFIHLIICKDHYDDTNIDSMIHKNLENKNNNQEDFFKIINLK